MDIERRIGSLRTRLTEGAADAVLVTKPSNILYLSGTVGVFDEHADVACIVTPTESFLVTTFIYAKAAHAALDEGAWQVRESRTGFYDRVVEELKALGAATVAIEASSPYGRFRYLSEHLEGRVIVEDQWVENLRIVKDAEELRRVRAAAELADAGFEFALERIAAGRSERAIALDLEFFLRNEGSEGVPFAPIVASGPNAANPHATVSDRIVASGDVVKLDFGARIDGYCSDMTRTVSVGPADARIREIHDAVLQANQAGIAAARAGRRAADIDAEAREVLVRLGYGDEFGHGLGHGVGLDVHEAPRLGPGSDDIVPAGAVVTVEPGVYVEGLGGVRIEDLVVVTDTGCEVLTESPRTLLEV